MSLMRALNKFALLFVLIVLGVVVTGEGVGVFEGVVSTNTLCESPSLSSHVVDGGIQSPTPAAGVCGTDRGDLIFSSLQFADAEKRGLSLEFADIKRDTTQVITATYDNEVFSWTTTEPNAPAPSMAPTSPVASTSTATTTVTVSVTPSAEPTTMIVSVISQTVPGSSSSSLSSAIDSATSSVTSETQLAVSSSSLSPSIDSTVSSASAPAGLPESSLSSSSAINSSTAPSTISSNGSSSSLSSAASASSTALTPAECASQSSFVLGWDDEPEWSGDPSDAGIFPPIFNPYHHLFFSGGYVYAPPPSDPYPPHSGNHLAVFLPNGSDDARPGELGAGPRAGKPYYNFDATSAWLGCDDAGPNACEFQFNGLRYDNTTGQEVVTETQEATIPACPGFHNCELQLTTFDASFTGLSGLQIQAYVNGTAVMFYMDDLAMEWEDKSCEAVQTRGMSR